MMTCGLCKRPIRGNENYVTDHYQCAVDMTRSWRNDLDHATAQRDEVLAALRGLLAQFDAGAFVRNTDSDGCSDWALKAAGPLAALAKAQQTITKYKLDGPAGGAPAAADERSADRASAESTGTQASGRVAGTAADDKRGDNQMTAGKDRH